MPGTVLSVLPAFPLVLDILVSCTYGKLKLRELERLAQES